MMLIVMRHAARLRGLPHPLGQVVHDRQVEQRLAAEERQRPASSGWTRSSSRSIQSPTLAGRLQRHLVGELVVVAVIALEAVVAREIALQRREHRDVQLGRVALDAR